MSSTPVKTSDKAKQISSPTGVLNLNSESTTTSKTPRAPIKNPPSSRKLPTSSKARRRLNYGLPVTKEIAQQDRTPIKKLLPPSPKTPIKKPPSPRTPSTRSKARRRLNYGLPVISEIAEQANREMSPSKRESLSKKLNGNPTPPNVTSLFAQIDPVKGQLNAPSRDRLQRAHSMANSVASLTNNNPNKIATMYNVENTLIKLLENKQKLSVNQLKTIAKLEKQLERSKEKHARATELIKEHMLEESVPIIITKKSTEEINKLTRQMEKLKNVSNLERSKLLGLIVSLARKKKNLTESIVNVRKAGTIKNKEVTKLKKYITAYENKINELQKIITKVKQEKNKPTMIKTVTRPRSITETDVKKIVKQMTNAKVPTTPPGITKTNLQQFLAPFKQPVSIKFAPSIQATGGAGGNATIIQTKNSAKKKQQPPKKQETPKTPLTRRKQSAIESKRKKLLDRYSPLVIKHKKDALAIINKLLSELKATRSEKSKLISLYSKSLSDKHIKSIFKHRTKDGLRSILVKQLKIVRKKR